MVTDMPNSLVNKLTQRSGRFPIFLLSLLLPPFAFIILTSRHQRCIVVSSIGRVIIDSSVSPLTRNSVAFYGDCILSRACHDNVIALWRIEGFSSKNPPPPQSIAPIAQTTVPTNYDEASRLTRSAFVPTISPQCPSQYTMLLQFHTPNCGPQFFMRFKLHFVPGQHPVLAFCNAGGNVFFWDLERLMAYREFMEALKDPARDKSKPLPHPSWMRPVTRRKADGNKSRHGAADKEASVAGQSDGARSAATEEIGEYNAETLETWASRYSQEDPHEPLKAHKTESSSANFVGRQAAWSPGGEWCVVVGSSNTALILQRWATKPAAKTSGTTHSTPNPDH
ncbi:hypothetical protein NW767_003890 [Fusarium falciforme]|nr:hypothetical protein NW767_003890 [Fusarium falciforme]